MLKADLAAGRGAAEFGAVSLGSGVTDLYQPVESHLQLTRGLLECLAPSGLPVVILTKNALLARDTQILQQFPAALVIVTVTTLDPALAAWLEPGASRPAQRLAIVTAAFAAAAAAGAQFVVPAGLTLRPGRQKELFLATLRQHRPDLVALYEAMYGENRQSGAPRRAPSARRDALWQQQLSAINIPDLIPWTVYSRLLAPHDAIFVLLCHLEQLYGSPRNQPAHLHRLRQARERYGSWLTATKKRLRRSHNGAARRHRNRTGAASGEQLSLAEMELVAANGAPLDSGARFAVSQETTACAVEILGTILDNAKLTDLCLPLIRCEADYDYVQRTIQ